MSRKNVRVYGADTFCLVLAQKLGLELISPDDDLMFAVPPALLGREIFRHSLEDAKGFSHPCIIKPITPKQFRAAVYAGFEELVADTRTWTCRREFFARNLSRSSLKRDFSCRCS